MAKKLFGLIPLLVLAYSSCKLQTSETTLPYKQQKLEIPEGGIQQLLRYPNQSNIAISAHRGGGEYEGYPENCLASFEFITQQVMAIIECDVRSTADGVLVLLHDETLDRTTTGSGKVEEKTWEEIKNLKLLDNLGNETDYHIPTLQEAIKWAKGKALLSLDVKKKVAFEAVIAAVEETETQNFVNIITYTLEAAKIVHRLAPDLMISCTIRNEFEFNQYDSCGIPWTNIIAFTGLKESPKALYDALHEKGVLCILGTIGNLDRHAKSRGDQFYKTCLEKGADILATDRPLEAALVLKEK